jgi:hypothetical protein
MRAVLAFVMTPEYQNVVGIAVAALGGAAVGLEREWSGHAGGPEAHFAGIRTFTLLGGLRESSVGSGPAVSSLSLSFCLPDLQRWWSLLMSLPADASSMAPPRSLLW